MFEKEAKKLLDLFESDSDGRYSFRIGAFSTDLYEAISDPMHKLATSMNGDMVYAETVAALEAIVNDGLESVEENIHEYTGSDIYTADLLRWLASNLGHVDYVDEAIRELQCTDLIDAVSYGQSMAKRQVWCAVIDVVRELEEEVE